MHIPLKWAFVFLCSETNSGATNFYNYERGGPLSVLQLRTSIFFTFEAIKKYLDFYDQQRGDDADPDPSLLNNVHL
jgi:hypothetical protein